MKMNTSLFVMLMFALPAMSAEHGELKSSASSHEYMTGMDTMHKKMSTAVNNPDPDKAFASGMKAHHEGAIAMAQTELKYGKDPEMRKLAQNIINAQKGEIDEMEKWISHHK